MSYLKFDKDRMVNLEYSLNREILRTNRRGAYHCTTLVECNTRKQHGLLVLPVPDMDNTNHVILSSFDETVIQHGAEFNLGIHKYDGDNYSPMGHKYIREFDCDSLPRTIYRVGGVVLSKEKMFSLKNNCILIRYTLLDAHSPTTLRFKPFLAFRGINSLTSENSDVDQSYEEINNGIKTCMYEGYPDLYMQFNKKVRFEFKPTWYKGIEYKHDLEDGLEYKEDLYVPGYFELPIKKGESIVFVAGDSERKPRNLQSNFERGIKERTPRSSFFNCLTNSAHQFYFRPSPQELYLLEGYPWFGVNARHQFVSLPWLTFGIGNTEAFEEVMDTAMPAIRQLLAGEPITGHIKGMDEPSIPLWIILALNEYANIKPETCWEKYGQLVFDLVEFMGRNKHPRVQMHKNALLYTDGRERPASWMNATAMGRPIVPRTGYLVEVNGLWYNAVMSALKVAQIKGEPIWEKKMKQLANKIQKSFNQVFVNDSGYLYDYVDGVNASWSVRPNMLIPVGLEYSPLSKHLKKSILEIAIKELLTPKGMRSLSPKSEGYSPNYHGSPYEQAYASMNGAVYPSLLSMFLNGYLKIFQRGGVSLMEKMIISMEEEMANDCVGSISQLYDGNPPFAGHGAPSYALNVSAMIQILLTYQSVNKEEYC